MSDTFFQVFNWDDGDEKELGPVGTNIETSFYEVFGKDIDIYDVNDLRTGPAENGRSDEGVNVSTKTYTIFASGRNNDGERKIAVIQGFPCYFAIELPSEKTTAKELAMFLEHLVTAPYRDNWNRIKQDPGVALDFIDYIVFATKKILHTVHGKVPRRIAYLVSRSHSNYRKARGALIGPEADAGDDKLRERFEIPVYRDVDTREARYINKYDSEISPMYIKMFHHLELEPTQFIDFGDVEFRESEDGRMYMCVADWRAIVPRPQKKNAPFVTLSFDIECDVVGGRFVTPKYKSGAEISTIKRFLEEEPACDTNTLKKFARHVYGLEIVEEWRNEYAPFKINRDKLFIQLVTNGIASSALDKAIDILTFENVKRLQSRKEHPSPIPLEGEPVTMISVVTKNIDGTLSRVLISHLSMKPGPIVHPRIDVVPDDPGIEIVKTRDEKNTLLELFRQIQRFDPDIITGYNIFKFDYEYIGKRLEQLKQAVEEKVIDNPGEFTYNAKKSSELEEVMYNASGIPPEFLSSRVRYKFNEIETSAGGKVSKKYYVIPLRTTYDLLNVIRREFNFSSYTLDNVSSEFLIGKVSRIDGHRVFGDVPTETTMYVKFSVDNGVIKSSMFDGAKFRITERFNDGFAIASDPKFELSDYRKSSKFTWHESKNDVSPRDIGDLVRSSEEGRYCVALYAIQDSVLPLRIIDRKMIAIQRIELSNVCRIPLEFAYNRAQDAKVFNIFRYFADKRGFVIPRFKDLNVKYQQKSFEGAYVFPPKSGLYMYRERKMGEKFLIPDLAAVLDFASLYPNEEISENMGHETYVPLTDIDSMSGKHVKYEFDVLRSKKDQVVAFKDTAVFEQPDIFDTKTPEGLAKLSVLAQMLISLYAFRKSIKREMYTEEDPEVRAILDGKQLGAKLVLNSAYGLCGSSTGRAQFGQIAASTTMAGRKLIHKTAQIIEAGYDGVYKVIYGDSVSGDTPVLVKMKSENGDEEIRYIAIEDIIPETAWAPDDTGKEIEFPLGMSVFSDTGFTKIINVVRHKTSKKMFRIWTTRGVVDVTEDHSLLDANGVAVKAGDIEIGTELLGRTLPVRVMPIFPRMRGCSSARYNRSGSVIFKNKVNAANFVWDLSSNGFDYTITKVFPPEDGNVRVSWAIKEVTGQDDREDECERVLAIDSLGRPLSTDYVYDIETENHHFSAGIGRNVVHNTDSVFLRVDIRRLDGAPSQADFSDQTSYERAVIEYAMQRAEQMSHEVSKQLGGTRDLELEKGIFPLLLLEKKRYIGQYFELDKSKSVGLPYIKSMGIEIKRRDNSPILKELLSRIITALTDDKSEEKALRETEALITRVLAGKEHWRKFVITKVLKKLDYANPEGVVQYVLAKRIKERTGTMPDINTRIEYLYVVIDDRDDSIKQGARVETPEYMLEHNLKIDYGFYVKNQLEKPTLKFFMHMSPEINARVKTVFAQALKKIKNKKSDRHRVLGGYADIRTFFHK